MKIPVILVTGFLGSGKTTFLHRLAEDNPHWRMLFLVNEFAEVSVDADKLAGVGSPVQSVVGGSLFCECRAAEFVRVMKETVLAEHQRNPLRAVIIETSGIADPEALGRVMRDFRLDEYYAIQLVVSITAPGSLLKLLDNLPNIAAQVRTSDLVVINKTDLSSEEEISRAEQRIRDLNPTATIVRCAHCKFVFNWEPRKGVLPDEPLAEECNPYSTETVTWERPVSNKQLQNWLESLPPTILRAKGTILTTEGWVLVEKTVEGLEILKGSASAASSLVLIVHDDDAEELELLAAQARRWK